VQSFPRYRFPADLLLSQGLMIDFSDSAGNTQAGMVKNFDSALVEIDFNHPLADRHIGFRAQIEHVEMAAGNETA
jgi:FKBP-type peptidyl-prolyl cis-trans isomerase SlpA